MQAAICVVTSSQLINVPGRHAHEYRVAAGVPCGPDNPYARGTGCGALVSATPFTTFDVEPIPTDLCVDFCSEYADIEVAELIDYREYYDGDEFDYFGCICLENSSVASQCVGVNPISPGEKGRTFYNICSGARSSAELLRHASLTHVMSFCVSERECDAYHLQSMGAGGWGHAVGIKVHGILEVNGPEHV